MNIFLVHHLLDLVHRNGPIFVQINSIKEKANFFFSDIFLKRLNKQNKVLEVQFDVLDIRKTDNSLHMLFDVDVLG